MLINLTIDNVLKAGSIRNAIIAFCVSSDSLSSGKVGQSCNGTVSESARNALSGECVFCYVNADDGHVATLDDDGEVVWGEPCVLLECPGIDEVAEDDFDKIIAIGRDYLDSYNPDGDSGSSWVSLVRYLSE